jgi:D-alanine-D-alanine ligase
MGGISAEREISLKSGNAVAAALAGRGHKVTSVDVTSEDFDLPKGTDVVFIALHGTYGEDGNVQAYLKSKGVPFTGADEKSSKLAFDKILSKKVFEKNGINTARYEILRGDQPRTLPLPVVVKPPRQGSSIGLAIVTTETEWTSAIHTALSFDEEILVESYIPGRELTIGVVGQEVLPIVEIRAPEGNYDYRAKYTKGVTEYLCPAPLDDETTRNCQQLAWRTFEALGVKGLGRVDVRLTDDGDPFVLELNTIPGFTETSLLPKAANAAGYSFPELCEKIIRLAMGRDD